MLVKCPECELNVSDKAITCPHCGYPLKETDLKKQIKRSSPKRRKLPNGFGQITKLTKKNLRKPYRAMITVGKNSVGKPISKLLKPEAYFATYNEAYEALVEYNKNPYDLDTSITVKELYEKWTEKYFKESSPAYQRTVSAAWAYCSSIYDMRAKDVRARHIKGCMEEGYRIEYRGKNKGNKVLPSATTKTKIKSLFNVMFDYALEFEIVDKNYARTFDISDSILIEKEANKKDHIVFTDAELNVMWDNVDKMKFVDWILIQCYMGWRPKELAVLKLNEVDLDKWTITGGMKTDAGKQRTVPVHSKIKDLIKQNYDFAVSIGSDYLFNDKGQTHSGCWQLTYDKYAKRFDKVIKALNLNSEHRPHDPRKTFVTRAKKVGIDDNAIKAIVGHKSSDITESAYTDRDIEWLRSDLEKMV